ncbi:self-incompatibility protein S1-like [Magnolia sinica]|uniref:self-incompatibility protein S1-like n=1 Tax=Magnolia sinica TaxID=86752 RepID=UPI0026599AC2|nr:self-incompatibility protein S1-like [Magnolia sinica]
MNLLLPSTITILFFFSLCEPTTSDKLIVLNRIGNGKTLKIYCQAPVDFHGWHVIPDGQNATVNIFQLPRQLLPSMCNGQWESSFPYPFLVYSHYRDHKRCRDECVWETNSIGLYVWDKEKKLWVLVHPWLDL